MSEASMAGQMSAVCHASFPSGKTRCKCSSCPLRARLHRGCSPFIASLKSSLVPNAYTQPCCGVKTTHLLSSVTKKKRKSVPSRKRLVDVHRVHAAQANSARHSPPTKDLSAVGGGARSGIRIALKKDPCTIRFPRRRGASRSALRGYIYLERAGKTNVRFGTEQMHNRR